VSSWPNGRAASTLSLLGLVRTCLCRARLVPARFSKEKVNPSIPHPKTPDADLLDTDPARCAGGIRRAPHEMGCGAKERRGRSLDTFTTEQHGERSLRWIYLHMIEEVRAHNGHADLLREPSTHDRRLIENKPFDGGVKPIFRLAPANAHAGNKMSVLL